MKRFLLAFLLLLIPVFVQAQTGPPPDPIAMQAAATATGNGTSVAVAYYGGMVIQITNSAGTFTITFEGTLDGTNYVSVLATNLSSGTQATTATAAGLYSVYAPGFQRIRARISACSSCATTASGRPVVAYISRTITSGGGGGSGTVTDLSIVTANGISGSVADSTTTPAITLTVQNGAADGSTKGIASFTAADFNASSGNISLDYTNAQAADATHKGFLPAADFVTFNAKQSAITFGTGVQTALGVNVGSAGALVLNGGALGTPSSGVATNLTGLPLTTGITGVLLGANGGTGVANTGKTITLGGNLVTSGAFNTTITATADSNATLPAGTKTLLATTGSPAALVIASQAAGDLLYADTTTSWARLPKGSDAQVLTLASGVPSWTAPAGGVTSITGTSGQITASASAGAVTLSIPSAMTGIQSITGVAGNMTITSGTGNSRTMILQTTTSGGTATTFLTGNADQSATFAGTVGIPDAKSFTWASADTGIWRASGPFVVISSDGTVANAKSVQARSLYSYNGGNLLLQIDPAATAGFGMASAKMLGWTGSATDASATPTSTLSQNAAGVLQFGTTAANASGSWLATNGTLSGTLSTGDPTSGAGPVWKLGAKKTGTLVLDTTNYVEISVAGVTYKVALIQ